MEPSVLTGFTRIHPAGEGGGVEEPGRGVFAEQEEGHVAEDEVEVALGLRGADELEVALLARVGLLARNQLTPRDRGGWEQRQGRELGRNLLLGQLPQALHLEGWRYRSIPARSSPGRCRDCCASCGCRCVQARGTRPAPQPARVPVRLDYARWPAPALARGTSSSGPSARATRGQAAKGRDDSCQQGFHRRCD